jgi:hypothetical protein
MQVMMRRCAKALGEICARSALRKSIFVGLLVAGLVAFSAAEARADPHISLSLERVGGLTYGSYGPDALNGSITVTTFGVGGVLLNPIAIPRVGFDVILPSGLTLGGAVGFTYASVGVNPNGSQSETESGTGYLLSPRVGYRLALLPRLDFVPRAGLTFVGGSVNGGSTQSCAEGSNAGVSNCTQQPGGSASLFVMTVSVDASVALRVTDSFNLLAGLAYDQIVAASASTTSNSQTTNQAANGSYLGLQAWFGLGGYL